MFIDTAKIFVKAGRGGDGAVSFRREKYVAAGGPDGGDGGRGGDVIFEIDDRLTTLMDFKYKKNYTAQGGADGYGKKCSGRDGEDLIIKIPAGTMIYDARTNRILADMPQAGKSFIAAKGGSGGFGNAHFATPTRQAPMFAKSGLPGGELELKLELKLLADVGLVGFPNVGKSTFLAAVSDAAPKIANYHFTTLTPNLGVVKFSDKSFVIADIPGIIEGASEGAGLGHDFLRHIERTRILVHIVDISGSEDRDPCEDFKIINNELFSYNKNLSEKGQIAAANKADLLSGDGAYERFEKELARRGYKVFKMSAATGQGVSEIIKYCAGELDKLPVPKITEFYTSPAEYRPDAENPFTVEVIDGIYNVSGTFVERIVSSTNFNDSESLQYFQRALIKAGVIEALKNAGAGEGDTVRMMDAEFDFVE